MLEYRVINIKTGEDITDTYDWVISPNGELNYLYDGDLCGLQYAKAVPVLQCLDIP